MLTRLTRQKGGGGFAFSSRRSYHSMAAPSPPPFMADIICDQLFSTIKKIFNF